MKVLNYKEFGEKLNIKPANLDNLNTAVLEELPLNSVKYADLRPGDIVKMKCGAIAVLVSQKTVYRVRGAICLGTQDDVYNFMIWKYADDDYYSYDAISVKYYKDFPLCYPSARYDIEKIWRTKRTYDFESFTKGEFSEFFEKIRLTVYAE